MTRLEAVESLLKPARVVADVGCDHGKIAAYCAESGMFDRVIASDVAVKCLDKAKSNLKNFDNVEFVLCDGIRYKCDEAVIAGMGGLLVSRIIKEAREAGLPETLVLCPHRNVDEVRRTVTSLGYGIDKDFTVKERGKYYSIIRAEFVGKPAELTELQYMFGAFFKNEGVILSEYLEVLLKKYGVAPVHNAEIIKKINEAIAVRSAADRKCKS